VLIDRIGLKERTKSLDITQIHVDSKKFEEVAEEEEEDEEEDEEDEEGHHYNHNQCEDNKLSRHTLGNHRLKHTGNKFYTTGKETKSPYNSASLITNHGNMRRSTYNI
jgi:hypothetical protein